MDFRSAVPPTFDFHLWTIRMKIYTLGGVVGFPVPGRNPRDSRGGQFNKSKKKIADAIKAMWSSYGFS